MDSRSIQSEPVGPTRSSVVGAIWQFAILILIVAPVALVSIFRTSLVAGSNRAGLLLPALILADEAHRRLIWLGFIGIGCSVLIALLAGLWLGFAMLSIRTRIGRLASWLAVLPSHGPVWVFPMFFAIWIDELKVIKFGQELLLLVWFVWAGWWGATRIALSVKSAAALVSQAEWEAARLLGASVWQSFRIVIKPRIQTIVCKDLKVVAASTLLDPTPVLIWGVSGWPMAELVHSLQRLDSFGVAVATTWALWMALILVVSNRLIQLTIGARHKNDVIQTALSSDQFRAMTFSMPFRSIIVVSIWPLFLMAGLIGLRVSKDPGLAQNLMDALGLMKNDILTQSAWFDGLVSGLVLSMVSGVLVRRLGYSEGVAETVRRVTVNWPIGFAVTGFTVWAMASQSISGGWQDLIFRQPVLWILTWGLILITFSMAGVSRKSAGKFTEAEIQDQAAAQEAAIGFGASVWSSSRMAKKTGSGVDDWVWMTAFFSQWWWVWASPAWGISGLILATPAPMWGSVLSGFAGLSQELKVILWALTIGPVLVAGGLKGLISRKTLR